MENHHKRKALSGNGDRTAPLKRGFYRIANPAIRLFGTPPRTVSLPAQDNGRFIASARQHCLLIIAVGFVSGQLACLESERSTTYATFAYLEKAFAVVSAMRDHVYDATAPLSTDLSDVDVPHDWHTPLVGLAGTSSLRTIPLDSNLTERLRTRTDPTGEGCRPEIYEFGPPEMSDWQSIKIGNISNTDTDGWSIARPNKTFLIAMSLCSGPDFAGSHAYVVVEYGQKQYGMVFHQGIYDRLAYGPYGLNGRHLDLRNVDFADYASLPRDGETQLLLAVRLTSLKNLVLRRALAIDGNPYSLSQLETAVDVVLQNVRRNSTPELWGVRVPARAAVLMIPGILLGAIISLLYRIRRIDPKRDLSSEPWIVVGPSGVIETAAAAAWVVSLFAATGSAAWTVLVYHGEDWSTSLLSVCGLVASMASVLILCQACRYLFRLSSNECG